MTAELVSLGRYAVAVILALAAVTKALDWSNSLAALAMYLGLRTARIVLPILIGAETGLALALGFGFALEISLVLVAMLFLAFAAFLANRIRTGSTEGSCGCFGLGVPSRVSIFGVLRNLSISLLCLAVAAAHWSSGSTASLSASRTLWLLPAASSLAIVLMSAGALETIRGRRSIKPQH